MAVRNNRSRRKYVHFTYKEAKKLSSTRNSCVVEVLHEMSLSMSPKFIGNIRLGLKETLGKQLLTHSQQLDGVPFAFDNIKVINSQIIDDQDLFKLVIKLSFIVFKPEPGKLLDAVVNKITDHHFGCVIHNCINGSVRQPNWNILTDEQKEVASNIDIGDVITFKVWKFDVHHGILFVLGDIVASCYQRIKRNSKLRKKKEKSTEELNLGVDNFTKKYPMSPPKEEGDSGCDKSGSYTDLLNNIHKSSDKSVLIKREPLPDDGYILQENPVEKSPKKKKTKKESTCSGDTLQDSPMEKSPQKKKMKKEPLCNGDTLEDNPVEKSPQRKKSKTKKDWSSINCNVQESTEELILIKKEPLPGDRDILQNNLAEKSPKKKKMKKDTSSDSEDILQDIHIKKSPKKKKCKTKKELNSRNDNNVEESSEELDFIKKEPLSDNEDILQGNHVEKSPLKKGNTWYDNN